VYGDRRATLRIGEGPDAVVREIVFDADSVWVLEPGLRQPDVYKDLPGPDSSGGAHDRRLLTVVTAKGERVFEVGPLPASKDRGGAAALFASLWAELCTTIDAPECIDHRERDERAVGNAAQH